MKKLNSISDVTLQFKFFNEIYYIVNDEIIDSNTNKKFSINIDYAVAFGEYLFASSAYYPDIHVLNSNFEQIKLFSGKKIAFYPIGNSAIISLNKKPHVLNSDFSLTELSIPYPARYCNNNKFVMLDKSRLFLTDARGVICWTYTLENNDTIVVRSIHFIDNKAIIPTKNSNLIILNLDNGSELYKLTNVPSDYLLSLNNDKLISFAGNSHGNNFLKVIDLHNAKVVHNSTFNNLFYGFQPFRSSIYKDKLYFICEDYKPDLNVDAYYTFPHLGRLDLKTYTIDWIKKIGDWKREGQNFEAPIVIDNHVYLKSLDNRAYIYEMDD